MAFWHRIAGLKAAQDELALAASDAERQGANIEAAMALLAEAKAAKGRPHQSLRS